jgi:hypothetical protein
MIQYILLSLAILSISSFTISIILEIVSVNAEFPIVRISPERGTTRDHKIDFTVNGFNPNKNVHWEFVKSKGNIDVYGYFETDEFGGFDEYIIADEMKPDTYTLRFFDDENNDFIKDPNGSEIILRYQIPCDNFIFWYNFFG